MLICANPSACSTGQTSEHNSMYNNHKNHNKVSTDQKYRAEGKGKTRKQIG